MSFFYLQKIINKEMKATTGKTINELKENALKLVGYSTDNEEILEKFDMTYEDSQMISGLKKKKDGFYVGVRCFGEYLFINNLDTYRLGCFEQLKKTKTSKKPNLSSFLIYALQEHFFLIQYQ